MRHSLVAAASAVVVLIGFIATGQDGPEGPSGWRTLFDGKSLEGWKHVGPGKMVLKDGELITEGGMGLFWYTREKLGDCVIRVVYKTGSPDANSGVFIRIADKPGDPWYAVHHGYEVQISDTGDEYHCTGAIYSLSKAMGRSSKSSGGWNTMEITLRGQEVLITLNGAKVNEFNPETAKIPERKKDYEPERGPRPTSGYIGLQNHGDVTGNAQVVFKEVSVRPLTKDETRKP
jgi:hypothetical protein